MESGVVEKCLAFCQALVTTNQTFSSNLTISKDNFNFTNKKLQGSSCRGKKKSPSQVRREVRRRKKEKRGDIYEEEEKVTYKIIVQS